MRIGLILLWLSLVTFAGFGFACAFFPHSMAALVEISLPTDTARVDFVATYGGLELGFAAFLWVCTRKDERVRIGLLATGCALCGFAVTRLVGIVLADRVLPILYAALIAEIAATLLAFWAAGRVEAHAPRNA